MASLAIVELLAKVTNGGIYNGQGNPQVSTIGGQFCTHLGPRAFADFFFGTTGDSGRAHPRNSWAYGGSANMRIFATWLSPARMA